MDQAVGLGQEQVEVLKGAREKGVTSETANANRGETSHVLCYRSLATSPDETAAQL